MQRGLVLYEKFVPIAFFLGIVATILFFSFKISNEVNSLTEASTNFYEHPYKVRNAANDIHLITENVIQEWSDQIRGINIEKGSEITFDGKFSLLDSLLLVIDLQYLGPRNQVLSLLSSYSEFKSFITHTDSNTFLDLNLEEEKAIMLLNNIILDLEPIENFAIEKAEVFMNQTVVEKRSLLNRLRQFFIGAVLFFAAGMLVAGYLLTIKNRKIYSEKEKFNRSISHAPIPIMIHKKGRVLQLSKEWTKLTGYKKEEISTIDEWSEKAFGENSKHGKEFIYKLYELKDPQDDGIWSIKTKSGDEKIWRFNSGPLEENTVISTAIDVTDDVLMQEIIDKLDKDRLKLAKAVDQSPVSIVITDTNGIIEYVNDYFSEITGYSFDEAIGKNPNFLKSGVHDISLYKDLWETISNGDKWFGNLQNKAKDGSFFWESVSISPIIDGHGKVINYVAVKENITDKIKSAQALVNSEKKYRDLFTLSTDACLILKDGVYIDCNNAALKVLGMYSKEELIGLRPADIAPEFQADGTRSDSGSIERILKANKEKFLRFEWLHKKVNGEVAPSEVMLTKIEDDGEGYLYVVWRDITARKKYEEQLQSSLEEKEVLLAEVHHRVKNNLAIVSGMLELQAFSSKNSDEVTELAKSVYRIKSIAIIHEQLYKTGNFVSISLAKNTRYQVDSLLLMYGEKWDNKVRVSYDMEDVKVNVNQAIPFGLLVNELATNSLKYAYSGIKEPVLKINLSIENDEILFVIHDNGVGFDVNEFNNTEGSLGHTLIKTFVSQLEGKLDIRSNSKKGTTINLIFKPISKKGSGSNMV